MTVPYPVVGQQVRVQGADSLRRRRRLLFSLAAVRTQLRCAARQHVRLMASARATTY